MLELRVQIHGPSGSGKTEMAKAIEDLVKASDRHIEAVIQDDPYTRGQSGTTRLTVNAPTVAESDAEAAEEG